MSYPTGNSQRICRQILKCHGSLSCVCFHQPKIPVRPSKSRSDLLYMTSPLLRGLCWNQMNTFIWALCESGSLQDSDQAWWLLSPMTLFTPSAHPTFGLSLLIYLTAWFYLDPLAILGNNSPIRGHQHLLELPLPCVCFAYRMEVWDPWHYGRW